MLKITPIDTEQKRTLVLEGKLVDPWVRELERSWTAAQSAKGTRTIVVDLKDVTAISEGGEALLFRMLTEGAVFDCARGVLTKHVLQQLARRREAQSRKAQGQL